MAKNHSLPMMNAAAADAAGYIWLDQLAEMVGGSVESVRCRLFRAKSIANKYAVYTKPPYSVGNYRKVYFPSEELLQIISRPVKPDPAVDRSTTYEQAIKDGWVWRDKLANMTGLSFVQTRDRIAKLKRIKPDMMKSHMLRLKADSGRGKARILYRPDSDLLDALRDFISLTKQESNDPPIVNLSPVRRPVRYTMTHGIDRQTGELTYVDVPVYER